MQNMKDFFEVKTVFCLQKPIVFQLSFDNK